MAAHGHHHGGHGHGRTGQDSSKGPDAFDFAEAAPRFRARADAETETETETERYRRLAAELAGPGLRIAADIGCGAASMAFAIAETVPGARVTAVDAEPAMLDIVSERAAERATPMDTALASVDDPEALAAAVPEPAGLLWAGHVLHHAADPRAALGNLAALLAPGGLLAVAEGGTAPQHLPWSLGIGRPGLELRLIEAGSRRLAAELEAHGGVLLDRGWNVAFEDAGLVDVATRIDHVAKPAPLTGDDLEHALAAFANRVEWFDRFLDDEDRGVWTRLLDADGPDWLGHRRDLHHLAFETVYTGIKSS